MNYLHKKKYKEVALEEEIILLETLLIKEVRNEGNLHKVIKRLKKEFLDQRVKIVLTTIINNSKFQIMSLALNQGQFSIDELVLIDSDSQQEISGATFSDVTFTVDDTTVLSVVQDPNNPNSITSTAGQSGETNVNVSATVSYVDSVSGQPVTKTLTLTVPYTVNAVTPVGSENVELELVQGTPQAVIS